MTNRGRLVYSEILNRSVFAMKRILCTALACLALQAHARVDLAQLQDASRTRNLQKLVLISESSRGELLEMYPRYHWLTAQLDTLAVSDARDFLTRHAGTPLAERFRSEWLKELGRRQDWTNYQVEYVRLDSPSVELRCFQAQAAMAIGQNIEAALNAARPAWFSGQQQPASCNPVFDALFTLGRLSAEDAWTRLRLALAANNTDLAAAISGRTDAAQPFSTAQLAGVRAQPEKSWPQPAGTREGRELALYILDRIARSDPEKAATLLQETETEWPQPDLQQAWRSIGIWGARKHLPQASSWLEKGNESGGSDESRAWAIRAALRQADWPAVLQRIETLPAAEQNEAAWRYWHARAQKATGRQQQASQEFIALADGHDFYNLLAREELGTVLESPADPYRASESDIREIQQWPGVRRAQALFEQDWRSDAVREWNWAMRGQPDPMLLAAAEYARRQGWYDRAIYSAERARQSYNFALRYLAPYRDIVQRQADAEGLEPAWVYGLMRQESRFVTDARSRVGAGGLMQLMPATAKWVANKLGWKKFDPDSVNDTEVNIALGSRYLGDVWKQLGHSQVLASAGYNAGPGRAKSWQADRPLEAAIYIENIPFAETRDYVKKVMANAVHYARIFGTGQTSLQERIGIIPARAGSNPDLP